jgi:hypothetical protein
MSVPSFPELAGLATYAEAARVGQSVDTNVDGLLRLQWAQRRLMHVLTAHLPSTPEWELKCALALHQWFCAQHVDAVRRRIAEMRQPAPPLDASPSAELHAFFDELMRSDGTLEFVSGVYGVAFPALADAYRAHDQASNALVDHPTRLLVRHALVDLEEVLAWGNRALAMVDGVATNQRTTRDRRANLVRLLRAPGGMTEDQLPSVRPWQAAALPPAAETMHPQRDERFSGRYNFEFPPHLVYNATEVPADERNLALLCKRTLEMDVPEMIASFLTERTDQPWEFYLDYSRQLWDEARHAMMGTVALTARGVDWTQIPLNVGFSLRLNLHAAPLERQILLYAIEQSLMPGDVGKRSEYETAVAAGDELSAHFHDYDWADEVLHAHIGRRALKRERITVSEAMSRAQEIHERTWAALDNYKHLDAQDGSWWPELVARVLGHESAVHTVELGAPKILSE